MGSLPNRSTAERTPRALSALRSTHKLLVLKNLYLRGAGSAGETFFLCLYVVQTERGPVFSLQVKKPKNHQKPSRYLPQEWLQQKHRQKNSSVIAELYQIH